MEQNRTDAVEALARALWAETTVGAECVGWEELSEDIREEYRGEASRVRDRLRAAGWEIV